MKHPRVALRAPLVRFMGTKNASSVRKNPALAHMQYAYIYFVHHYNRGPKIEVQNRKSDFCILYSTRTDLNEAIFPYRGSVFRTHETHEGRAERDARVFHRYEISFRGTKKSAEVTGESTNVTFHADYLFCTTKFVEALFVQAVFSTRTMIPRTIFLALVLLRR